MIKKGDLDVDASNKLIDTQVKDADWNPILKTAADYCNKEMADVSKYQKEAKFSKEECNIKFAVLVDCITIKGFAVRVRAFIKFSFNNV